ncbi:MAG TPA: hypothetical protein VGI99_03250 [Gemmataceae bacterium]|jgi:hypothetical protein
MPTVEATPLSDLEEALEDLQRGIRRPDKMHAAAERMDRLREENRMLHGETDIAVELIRQTREGA